MLPINIDNLSAYLKPPNGYKFQKGLATTYSLHLDTLLTIPMFLDGTLSDENAVIQNYASVVSTINKFRDSFKVYVQRGEIKTSSLGSKKASKLYELLREVIKEIPKDTKIASFHPKLWLLQYGNNIDLKYKLIILSKNLTNSQDLDIAVVFDSVKVEKSIHKKINESLIYFLGKVLEDTMFMQNELNNIEWKNIDGYSLKNFYILPKDSKKLPFFNSSYIDKKSIVFSPFISNNIFEDKNENILITREDEIDKQICKEIYTINSSLENTQELDEEVTPSLFDDDKESNKISINQLHAKIYISYPKTLIFGSANATHRGLRTNNEILIELEAPNNFYIDTKKYIQDDKNKLFVKLQKEYETQDKDKKLESLNQLLDYSKRIIVNGNINVEYSVEDRQLTLKSTYISIDDVIKMEVSPVSKNSFKEYKDILIWENMKYIDITGWFRFKLSIQSVSKEFLMNDEKFKLNEQYLKSIKKEANDKSEKYLEAHLISLLNDGRITSFEHRDSIQKDKDEDIHNYCSKQERNEDNLYDLLLDRFSSSKEHYNQALLIMKKLNKDGYKELLEILPKAIL